MHRVGENALNILSLTANHRLEKALETNNIYIHWKFQSSRKMPPQFSVAADDLIEPFTGFFAGNSFCSMGAFSYSHSSLEPGLVIGRYCAIAWGLTIPGPRHPYEWITVSNITYDQFSSNVRAYFDRNPQAKEIRDPRNLEKPLPIIGNDVSGGRKRRGSELSETSTRDLWPRRHFLERVIAVTCELWTRYGGRKNDDAPASLATCFSMTCVANNTGDPD
jgi:hypothetical protein